MARIVYANNAESTLAGAISTSATSISVQSGDGAKFPVLTNGDWSQLTLVKLVAGVPTREIVKMTGKTGDVLTVVRAQEGTTGLTFNGGDRVEMRVTASGLNGMATSDAPAFTGQAQMNGGTTSLAALLVNAAEKITINATAATGTINFDVTTQALVYHTVNATANWTVNLRGNASNALNLLMQTGQSVTVSLMATQGATPYYCNTVQVDGVAVTPKWVGGTAPTSGNASSIDIYTFTVIKTGNSAFTVIASQGTAK